MKALIKRIYRDESGLSWIVQYLLLLVIFALVGFSMLRMFPNAFVDYTKKYTNAISSPYP